MPFLDFPSPHSTEVLLWMVGPYSPGLVISLFLPLDHGCSKSWTSLIPFRNPFHIAVVVALLICKNWQESWKIKSSIRLFSEPYIFSINVTC